jgi:DNA segregation ATPase FtsK/SpoIIIE-like protein
VLRRHHRYGGDTRSGKSNALDSLLVQLHHQTHRHGYQVRLLIGDFKRGKDGILERYTRFERYGETHGRVIRNIADFTRASGQHLPLTFMCLDELNALLTVADRDTRLADSLRVVLQLGAGAGVYVASGAHYLSAKVFSRDGSKQWL